jgi:hypothetical protein
VCRQNTDDADSCGRQFAARHGQIEKKRARPTDDCVIRPRSVHALERQQGGEALHALLVRDHAEVLTDRKDRMRELVEILDSANVEGGQKSSGQ